MIYRFRPKNCIPSHRWTLIDEHTYKKFPDKHLYDWGVADGDPITNQDDTSVQPIRIKDRIKQRKGANASCQTRDVTIQ